MVFVSGRVRMPGQITLPQGSSLNQALVASDGPKLIRGKIEFVRFRNGGKSERRIFNYRAEEPIASYKNPILMDGDLIRVQDNILSATSTALGELTSPFIGIYSIYNFFNGVFNVQNRLNFSDDEVDINDLLDIVKGDGKYYFYLL